MTNRIKLADLNAEIYDTKDIKGAGVALDCPCGNCEPFRRLTIPFENPISGGRAKGCSWMREGSTLETLTLSPSIRRLEGCKWHGWIKGGVARSA